ncbi:hypothetical protein PHLCEN_2v2000 [Hermanssonia centrifuga]|uniref:Uncharacterized protein n=1 Tax=Hermanssonia centrifuga TaxID=98765 RepID=A0A2R6RQB8_9APHY|nr:hypothetical protein PHLCEN_2v2000 [Hermanssonia centrifuga]
MEMIPIRSDVPSKASRAVSKMKVKSFTPSASEETLKRKLYEWRDRTAQSQYGDFEYYGADMFMHISVVERIVDLAHVYEVNSVTQLTEQTQWCNSYEFGQEIVELVQKYCPKPLPKPLFTSVPQESQLRNLSAIAVLPATSAPLRLTRAPPRCGSCHQVGHKKNSPKCPNKGCASEPTCQSRWPAEVEQDSENIPPT